MQLRAAARMVWRALELMVPELLEPPLELEPELELLELLLELLLRFFVLRTITE